jgi:hypothetical protein
MLHPNGITRRAYFWFAVSLLAVLVGLAARSQNVQVTLTMKALGSP